MTEFISSVSHLWSVVWTYKVSLAPVLLTYLLFDFPAIVRRLTRVAYVPIYFIVFPFGHSDQLYAEYLNEDDFYGVGQTMTPEEKRALRRKIQSTAIISMVFAAVIAPWLCGFVSAFYLTRAQFAEFLVFFFVIKIFLISKSLWNLRQDSRAASQPLAFVSVVGVYILFLGFVWYGLTKSFDWTSTHLDSKGVFGLLAALADYAYVDLIINVGVVAALTWAFTVRFTDPENITKVYGGEDETDAPSPLSPSTE
jgi:hypothetical protein